METLPDGTPQIEHGDDVFSSISEITPVSHTLHEVNLQLREWSMARRCVKCKFFELEQEDKPWCDKFSLFLNVRGIMPESHSCNAFMPTSSGESKISGESK